MILMAREDTLEIPFYETAIYLAYQESLTDDTCLWSRESGEIKLNLGR